MTEMVHRNFIGGSWREGADARSNSDPSDTFSSYGPCEQGRYAMDFHTTVKTAYIAP